MKPRPNRARIRHSIFTAKNLRAPNEFSFRFATSFGLRHCRDHTSNFWRPTRECRTRSLRRWNRRYRSDLYRAERSRNYLSSKKGSRQKKSYSVQEQSSIRKPVERLSLLEQSLSFHRRSTSKSSSSANVTASWSCQVHSLRRKL